MQFDLPNFEWAARLNEHLIEIGPPIEMRKQNGKLRFATHMPTTDSALFAIYTVTYDLRILNSVRLLWPRKPTCHIVRPKLNFNLTYSNWSFRANLSNNRSSMLRYQLSGDNWRCADWFSMERFRMMSRLFIWGSNKASIWEIKCFSVWLLACLFS